MEFIKNIEAMIIDMLGPLGPLMLVGALGFMMIIMTLPILLKKSDDPLDKLKINNQRKVQEMPGRAEKLRAPSGKDKLEKYSNFLEPQDAESYSAAKLTLVQAGYRDKNSVRMFHFLQFTLGIIGLIAGVAYTLIQNAQVDVTSQQMAMWIIGPGGVGYMIPKYWVTRRVAERQKKIENGFPDSLDMMLV